MRRELEDNTKRAFEFVQKLYFQISYLIKEVEGTLAQQPEEFVIVRNGGYCVTTRSSTGLEPAYVQMWFPKNLSVFFCSNKNMTDTKRTVTPLNPDLRVVVLDVAIVGDKMPAPRVLVGCLRSIQSKTERHTKFENLMSEFAYCRDRIFNTLPRVSYEDAYCSFEGEFRETLLYSISDALEVNSKLVTPMLKLYRA